MHRWNRPFLRLLASTKRWVLHKIVSENLLEKHNQKPIRNGNSFFKKKLFQMQKAWKVIIDIVKKVKYATLSHSIFFCRHIFNFHSLVYLYRILAVHQKRFKSRNLLIDRSRVLQTLNFFWEFLFPEKKKAHLFLLNPHLFTSPGDLLKSGRLLLSRLKIISNVFMLITLMKPN